MGADKISRKRIWNIVKVIGFQLLFFILLLSSFSLLWVKRNYSNIGIEEIIFHLNMPLKGASNDIVADFVKTAAFPTLLFWGIELLAMLFSAKQEEFFSYCTKHGKKKLPNCPFKMRGRTWTFLFLAWGGILLYTANRSYDIVGFARNQFNTSMFIEEEYVNPDDTAIKFPKQKRNLICIYLESGESSAQDKKNGGVFDENYIPEMTRLAKDNISFSQSELIEGAAVAPACGWTIAGLVAETGGLPLKLFTYDDKGVDNSMKKYQYFLPGMVSMGEILEREGYHNYFLAGSNFNFGGRRNYYTQHGNYTISDYESAKKEGKIPKDYRVWWGYEDEKLYSFAREQLEDIAKKGEPFNYSMLTVDTHQPNGYICRKCKNKYGSKYANVWACASEQLMEFVQWVKRQDFYDNTTIAIYGDHCSMVKNFYKDMTYDKHYGETKRKVYNAIIHSAVQPAKEKNRKFTTMDFFPTTLASIGAEIEGDRLGLGTNLFSEKKTLSEEYGYEKLFEELDKKSIFYNRKILYP